MALFESIVLIMCLIKTSCCQPNPEVHMPLGTIIGKTIYFRKTPVNTYQSIPYAKPPIDEYRFKKPEPIEKWEEPLVADHLPPGCIQYSSHPFPFLDDLPGQSLDCLYLNIWVPINTSSSDRKAIMFFVHGGGFRISSSRLDFYDGRALAALGDVIVVTTNFRLGPEGFLYFGTEDAPGNMGLYDILESLKWVHSNIQHFSGDKNQITLFGQSAGAIAISMFLVSPLVQGLFVRAIFQSGSAANLDGEGNEKDFQISQGIAEYVGCASGNDTTADIVACLRTMDALKLIKTIGKVSDNTQRGLYPRFGDEILPGNARKALIEGNFKGMDTLIGNNQNEGATLITKAYADIFGFFGHKLSHINRTFGEEIIRENFKNFPNVEAVISHYLAGDKCTDVLLQVQTSAADKARVCPSVYLAESISEKGNHVFYYVFTQRPSVTKYAPWMGVVHFDETPFVFGYPLRYYQNYTESDQKLSRFMVGIWTTFAKTGNVGHHWPLYSSAEHKYMEINHDHMSIQSGPQKKNCDFFRPIFGF